MLNYEAMLNQAQSNYGNIMSGYQQTLAAQEQAQQGIQQGYNQLYGNVMGAISGIGRSQSQAIADQYAQQVGRSTQGLVSAGLGNTTVTSSVGRGLALDKAKADIALSNQLAQLKAGYMSQLGLAGLNYRNQAAMQNTALMGQQLGYGANYQRELGGWAMQGLGMDQQMRLAQMRGWGGGAGGGGNYGMYRPPVNYGGGGGGGGGYDTGGGYDPYITIPNPNQGQQGGNPWEAWNPEEEPMQSGYMYSMD